MRSFATHVMGAATFLFLALTVSLWGADQPPVLDGPLPPDRALATFRLEPGLRVELVAAEPLIESPVAMAFDERGRLFVAENRGYPTGPGEGQPPAGRIALLEDTDGDGRFDKRSEFVTGLTFPNGVLPWNGGLIVTCAPDVLFFKDTDGDGRADDRQVLFTGFATTGSTQLRVSHPTLGIDGWIYLTSGLTGGKVTSPAHPGREPIALTRTDFRFRPGTDQFEAADGGAQFGLTFDDFGRRFICYNRVQVQHVVLSSHWLRRNPHLAFSETVQNCPEDLSPEPLRGHGAAARLYPISQNVTTADSHAGTFTAACGVTVFRGAGLPDGYKGGVFSCDPTGNLVHFDLLEQRGATFAARRAREGVEFLASTDNWFRPVFLAHGPEGALYIADMYRQTIEHPDYLPVEIRKRTSFEGGKGMGRIYRVVRSDAAADDLRARRHVNLTHENTEQLCRHLHDADGWLRDMAQRLLLERRDKAVIPQLKALLAATDDHAAAAVHSLRCLEAFDAADDATLLAALKHRHAPVRETALQLVEPRLTAESPFVDAVLASAADPDARVRFQGALILGTVSADPRVIAALVHIARRDPADRWLRAAVLSSVAGHERELLDGLLTPGAAPRGSEDLFLEVGRLVGASQPPANWPALVGSVAAFKGQITFENRAALLCGLAESLRNRGARRDGGSPLLAVLAADDAGNVEPRATLVATFEAAKSIAIDSGSPLAGRRMALRLLAHSDFPSAGGTLLSLVDPQQPAELQAAAIRGLAGMQNEAIAATLLASERFAAYSPALREEVLSAMLSGPQHLSGLLTAVEAGVVPLGSIDSLRRRQLTENKDAAIRERAAKLFAAGRSGDRGKIFEDHKSVLALTPNPDNGRAVFRKTCASCHRLDREGFPVGPDLFGIRNQPKEAILLHILIPEFEITPGFFAYVIETRDGRVLTGLLSSETATSVTLKQPLGKEETVLRTDIERLASSKQSLMPQELEKTHSKQDFADLLAYLKGEGG